MRDDTIKSNSFMTRAAYVILAVGIAVLLGTGIYLLFRDGEVPITNYPPDGNVVVAFGDSLVSGIGSDRQGGFVLLLSDRLGIPIVNSGVPGDTTKSALPRLSSDVLSYDPDIVLILLGGNDFLKRVPEEETFENLQAMINEIQGEGAITVLLGIQGGVLLDSFKTEFEKLGKSTGSIYVPNVLDGILGNNKYMFDAIHPNDAGYKIIADKIYPHVEFLLSM